MKKIIRQSVGIDCSQEKLDVSFGKLDEQFNTEIISTTLFKNEKRGWERMLKWSRSLKEQAVELVFVVEATGVYHEGVSQYLCQQGEWVGVMLPNKVKNFSRTLKVKTVTDKVSAQTILLEHEFAKTFDVSNTDRYEGWFCKFIQHRYIARLGLEKKLDRWQPPHVVFNTLKQLTREHEQLQVEKTQILCQHHAEKSSAWPNQGSMERMKQRVQLIRKQIALNEAPRPRGSRYQRSKDSCTL